MPRDSCKPSLIQKIATQAQVTFKNCDDGKDLLANLAELSALLSDLRAADLNITPPKKKKSCDSGKRAHRRAPVTYMHICETSAFSMGVFALRSGVSIPLHDHPGMNGMLKVLYGKIRIRCFDKLDGPAEPELDPSTVSAGAESESESEQKDEACPAVLRSSGEFTQQSAPCVLSPRMDNLHQIDSLDGPAAFLDILAPPYDPDDGRDCHYYRVLRTASKKGDEKQGEEIAWLIEVPQPEDFWCGGEPYPGTKVSV